MDPIKHILIATDGSELSLKAAEYGGTLARALGAAVSIVTIIDEGAVVPEAWGPGVATESARRNLEQRARDEAIARTVEAVGDLEAEVRTDVLWGHVANELCRYAESNNVDMILMGSHGRTGIKRAILGSVSHSVANQAPCAVTIVR